MSKVSLLEFLAKEIESAKKSGILLSLHLKATMMKISDPIIFSHFLSVFFKELVNKHSVLFEEIKDFKNGFTDLLNRMQHLPKNISDKIEKDIKDTFLSAPEIAMVDSGKEGLQIFMFLQM